MTREETRANTPTHKTVTTLPPQYFQPPDHSWFIPFFQDTYLLLSHLVLCCFKRQWLLTLYKETNSLIVVLTPSEKIKNCCAFHNLNWIWLASAHHSTHHDCLLSSLLTIMVASHGLFEGKDVQKGQTGWKLCRSWRTGIHFFFFTTGLRKVDDVFVLKGWHWRTIGQWNIDHLFQLNTSLFKAVMKEQILIKILYWDLSSSPITYSTMQNVWSFSHFQWKG